MKVVNTDLKRPGDLLKRAHTEVAQSVLQDVEGRMPLQLPTLLLRVPRLQSGSNAPHSNYVYDLLLPYLLTYLCADQKEKISVSVDPFVAFPMANLLISKGFKVVRETDDALQKRSAIAPLTLAVRSQTKEDVLASLEHSTGTSGGRSKL